MKYSEYVGELIELARSLPTGLKDTRAYRKLERERVEFAEAMEAGDRLGALLEAADRVYYAVKALANGYVPEVYPLNEAVECALELELPPYTVLEAAVRKYRLRARPGNPKDDAAERAAVADLLRRA